MTEKLKLDFSPDTFFICCLQVTIPNKIAFGDPSVLHPNYKMIPVPIEIFDWEIFKDAQMYFHHPR